MSNTQHKSPHALQFGLPVGEICVFYAAGERNGDPYPARVFRHHGGGMMDIVVTQWGQDKPVSAVRHVDDPYLNTNPAQKKNGAWDYVMGHEPESDRRGSSEGSIEERVLAMHAQGKKPGEIATALAVKGINGGKVAQIIREYTGEDVLQPVG